MLLVLIAFLSILRLLSVRCGLLAIALLIVLFIAITLTLGLALVGAVLGVLIVGVRHCEFVQSIIWDTEGSIQGAVWCMRLISSWEVHASYELRVADQLDPSKASHASQIKGSLLIPISPKAAGPRLVPSPRFLPPSHASQPAEPTDYSEHAR